MASFIVQIGSYIPSGRKSNYDKKEIFKIDDKFIEESIGIQSVARMSNDEDTSDLCYKAFRNLLAKNDLLVQNIDCIIVCTQNPDQEGLPSTSSIVHSKIGARKTCAAFDISIGCSGYVYGLSILKSFLESNQLSTGLLFTCDPYSKIINEGDKNTSLLFGDAATVSLIINSPKRLHSYLSPTNFVYGTRGDASALYKKDGFLVMNGRAVYNFSATEVPQQINNLLTLGSTDIDEIDIFVFHQGSKFLLNTLIKRLHIPSSKVPIDFTSYGNTVSSSIPLILEKYLDHSLALYQT